MPLCGKLEQGALWMDWRERKHRYNLIRFANA
jgi:hypothetical protein